MTKPLLLLTFISISIVSFSQSKWKLEKDDSGIQIFTRKYEGKNFKEFKATTMVSCSMNTLVDLMEKVEDYPKWQANVESGKLLKRVNAKERFLYSSTDLPWPFDDRDIVVYSKKTTYKNGAIKYEMESRPNYIEPVEGYLRIAESYGYWKFVPKENGQIKVIYQFYGDPGGSLPASIINMFIVDGPFDTMINLKTYK